jgi:two-component sensor histidine kinase
VVRIPRRCLIRAQIDLDAVALSPRLARRFIADTLAPWADLELVDAAELLVSELVTNAVVHAHSPTRVVIVTGIRRADIRIEVHDAARDQPRIGGFDPDALSGRGLALVDALSDRWGVEPGGPTAPGNRVWFELRATRSGHLTGAGSV